MIITCPNCHTKYQIAQKAIGSAGRKVMCASCNQPWQAIAESENEVRPKPKLVETKSDDVGTQDDDKLFDIADEAALDDEFVKEERALKETTANVKAGVELPSDKNIDKRRAEDKQDSSALPQNNEKAKTKKVKQPIQASEAGFTKSKRQKAMQRRQNEKAKKLPFWRAKQNARFFMVFTLLAIIIGGGYFKTDIVRVFPQMAVLYEAFGQEVNVFGLEFSDVKTIRSISDGNERMEISAKISNITKSLVDVPIVIVSIVDVDDNILMQWGATPAVQTLEAGETISFKTQLNTAPVGSKSVNLSFAEEWKN